jgi:tetratricopeptide (TPR) repeat protein
LASSGNLLRADALMRDALTRLPSDRSPRDRFRFVFAHGYITDRAGKLEDAVRLNHEALALADRQDEPWRRAGARSALAYSYFGAQQIERARALSLEAIAIAEKAHDEVAMAHAYNAAGIVLDAQGDQQGERRSFELAIEHARRAGAKIDEALYLANLADFFLKNGDYKTALAHAEQALPLTRELKDVNSETVALINIGLAHISLKHFDLGKQRVQEAIAIDERRATRVGHRRVRFVPRVHPQRRAAHIDERLADMALYTAKNQGRNRAFGITSTTASTRSALRDVEADFDRAWHEGRVTLLQSLGPEPLGTLRVA